MPSNLQFADSAFPNLTAEQSQEEKTRVILNYLYMLLEQLRYSFANIGAENFNETALTELITLIREPVYVQLSDVEGNMASLSVEAGLLASRMQDAEGNLSTLTQTAEGLATRVQNAEGSISTLTQTAAGLTTRVQNAEGNISTLTQTATSFSTRLSDAEGSVSSIVQTVNSISLSVENGENSSQIKLTKNGVAVSTQTIQMTGLVTFAALGNSGTTTINGDNIKTGTITGTTLISREYAATPAWVTPRRTVAIQEGSITFGYDSGSSDPQTAGTPYGQIYTDYQNGRFYIGTPEGRVLKVFSGGNMSIDAANFYNIYIGTQDGTRQTIHIGKADSTVYICDKLYTG